MRVVIDANVFVSALISKRGAPHKIVYSHWIEAQKFEVLLSSLILDEIERVLNYPRLTALGRFTAAQRQEFLKLLAEQALWIDPGSDRFTIASDESDNRYLECAVAGNADYVVTGDRKHLLPIASYAGISIIEPAAFLEIVVAE